MNFGFVMGLVIVTAVGSYAAGRVEGADHARSRHEVVVWCGPGVTVRVTKPGTRYVDCPLLVSLMGDAKAGQT